MQPGESSVTASVPQRHQDVNEVTVIHFDSMPGDSRQARYRDRTAGKKERGRCALPVAQNPPAIFVDPRQDYLPWTLGTGPVPYGLLRHEARTRLLTRDDAVLLAQNGGELRLVKLG